MDDLLEEDKGAYVSSFFGVQFITYCLVDFEDTALRASEF